MITNDPSSWPSGDLIWTVAQAIARQEGYTGAGNAPFRYNNPGDLSQGDEHGQAIIGYVRLPDGEWLINFPNAQSGWNALYSKLSNILNGASSVYSPQMTWRQIGRKWASDPNWANGVCSFLGVSPDSTFASFFAQGPQENSSIDLGPGQIIFPGDQAAAALPAGASAVASDLPTADLLSGGQIPTPALLLGLGLLLFLFLRDA